MSLTIDTANFLLCWFAVNTFTNKIYLLITPTAALGCKSMRPIFLGYRIN